MRLIHALSTSTLLMGCVVRGEVGHNGTASDESFAVGPIPSGTLMATRALFQGEDAGNLGLHNAILGDLDGDGFDDFALLDPDSDGATYLFYGKESFPEQNSVFEADAILRGGQTIAGVGDLNGDGLDDLAMVGARAWNGLVIYGSRQRLSGDHEAAPMGSSIEHPTEGVTVMSMVKGAGDVNGDGFDDLQVELRNGQEAFVFLIHGSPLRLPSNVSLVDADATFSGAQDGFRLGFGASSAGDVNGDGYADLLLPMHDDAGRTRVAMIYGGDDARAGAISLADVVANLEMPTNANPIVPLGDLDGDGLADFAIASETRIATFYGQRQRFSGTVVLEDSWFSVLPEGGQTNFRSAGVATGDLDNDGHNDIVVGDPHHSRSEVIRGALYAVLGAPHRYETEYKLGESSALMYGTTDGFDGNLGSGVAGGGDVNGDGYDDILVGAPKDGGTAPGAVYLVLGGPRMEDGSTPPPEP